MFKDFMILHMYIAQGQGQTAPNILMVTKLFYYLSSYFEKTIFQSFPHTNVLGCKFDPAIKISKNHHLNKFGRSSVLYAIF